MNGPSVQMESATTPAAFAAALLINKPSGPSSYDMIRHLKRRFKGVKIGHSGTLDPLASGLLIILLGRATKKQSAFMALRKTYRCKMVFGRRTDTADVTGLTVEESPLPQASALKAEEALQSFVGEIEQTPPMYSALKHQGKPLYKLARKGISIDLPPRKINVYEMSLLNFSPQSLEFLMVCSAGTYVRTMTEQIAERLGACGTMSALVREKIGEYSLEKSLDGRILDSISDSDLKSKLIFL